MIDSAQSSTFAELDARLPGVSPEDEAYVRGFLVHILPQGVPTYLRRVLSVEPHSDDPDGIEATVEIFDGGKMFLKLSGPDGEEHLRFGFPTGDMPFHWHARTKAWRRLPSFRMRDQEKFLRSVDRLFKALK
ncbi:hypothetical protein [Methylobacterium frigidaeris]|uniref:Uncharacterized protein n=1 Tax=Methylobacterium frigidaeris TaxID=2038277 RepID=A0AA37M811_9HYPH|nr:hypothetical protein [Methylobacterium frigidaeris]GJD66460.1 hypothetical protein MPEAHAMD_6658 [Methylobacterium frigidaeris]